MAQVQKWWELSGAGGGQKQQIQPMAAGYVGKVEVSNDTVSVVILNAQGEVSLEKPIAHLASSVQTTDGLDSLGNAYLWLTYTRNLGTMNNLVLEKLNSNDSITAVPFYSSQHHAFYEPLKLICDDQNAILLAAVYLPDSTSFLRWLKFDAYSGLLTDSFSTAVLNNTKFSYAESFGNKAIVHGSSAMGKKNWLLDFSNAPIQEWQWNYGSIDLIGDEKIAFTRNEDIFSVIHTETDSTQIDALLTLCDTNFTVSWTIRYNSEFNLNDSIVDLAFYQDKIYVAGYVQKDSVNKDYLIASLNHDGTMNWELKYDGPRVASIDLGVSLCVDEVGDVFFTGHSIENDQTHVFSIQLNQYGAVLWESDFAESLQRRATEVVTRDGSLYLTGQSLSNSINNFVILYKDSLKIESIQKIHLKMLATGFSVIQEDSTLKSLVWDKFSRQYSFRRTVSFSSMQRFLRSKGKDLYRLMNAKINRDYKLDRASPTVELILASLKSRKEIPFIHFPFLDSLRMDEFVESRETIFAYSQSWPESLDDALPCVYCPDPITLHPGLFDVLVVNLEGNALPFTNNDHIVCPPRNVISCIYENTAEPTNACNFSCVYNNSNEVELMNSVSGTFEYELEIKIPTQFYSIPNYPPAECVLAARNFFEENDYFSQSDVSSHSVDPAFYVPDVFTLKAVGRNKPYTIVDRFLGTFKSTCYPIGFGSYYGPNDVDFTDENNWESVSSITLCKEFNLFGLQNEQTSKWGLTLASGGLYELKAEFSNVPPIYFAQVWGDGMFYAVGPDLSLYPTLFSAIGDYCVNGVNGSQTVIRSQIDRCVPCTENVVQLFGETLEQHIHKRIVSYDFDQLREFWEQSKLYIGFNSSSSSDAFVSPNNFFSLPIENLPNCVEMTNPELVCEFGSLPDGTFKFRSAGVPSNIPTNVSLNIEVVASFEDGTEINSCFSHTIIDNTLTQYPGLTILPTGRLREYLPNSTNYRVRIYKAN